MPNLPRKTAAKLVGTPPPHPATVAQPKARFGTPPERPPHPATVVQRKAGKAGQALRPTHAATSSRLPLREQLPAASPVVRVGRVLQRMERASDQEARIEYVHFEDGLKNHRQLKESADLKGLGCLDIHLATVHNAHLAYYFVPDPGSKALNVEHLKGNSAHVTGLTAKDIDTPSTCAWKKFLKVTDTFVKEREDAPESILKVKDLVAAAGSLPPQLHGHDLVTLRSLKQWHDFYAYGNRKRRKDIPLMVNANWFSIDGMTGYPHLSPVTFLMGPSVRKGKVVSSHTQVTEHDNVLDALAVFEGPKARKVDVLENHEIAARLNEIKFAVGGFCVLKNGVQKTRGERSASPLEKKRRSGVGISENGETLHVVVVETEIQLNVLSAIFVALGDHCGIDLDNSGSSQMVYQGSEMTAPADMVQHLSGVKRHRLVPNFFGVGLEPMTKPNY